jgi:beta-galactosidase
MKKILSILLLSFSVTTVFAQYQLRLRENFDFDWKFSLSDDIEYANLDYAMPYGKMFSCSRLEH